jgi:2-iminobutanoate/2-iminopropanoate deaminase
VPNEAVTSAQLGVPSGAYSHAVRNGQMLFISGQLPFDENGALLQGTVAQQTACVLQRIRALVTAAGGTLRDLAQLTVYVSEIEHWSEVDSEFRIFFQGVLPLPTRAIVPVTPLHYGAALEIQAIAIIAPSDR